MSGETEAPLVVLVTGLSGAGKNTILHMLEDLGFEAVDNPPLPLLDAFASHPARLLAIGTDARTHGFDPARVLAARAQLAASGRRALLVYATASDEVLLRRFGATRRLHPLAREGRVADAIAAERAMTAPLEAEADLVIDTTALPIPDLRRLVEGRLAGAGRRDLTLSLVSFAYPKGLPPDADLVFDARFLKNPHYDPMLQPLTGLDREVSQFVEQDPDYEPVLQGIMSLLRRLVPRFVTEGKKYATVAIGCTGGRHRSVSLVEDVAKRLRGACSAAPGGSAGVVVTVLHRELGDGVRPLPSQGAGPHP